MIKDKIFVSILSAIVFLTFTSNVYCLQEQDNINPESSYTVFHQDSENLTVKGIIEEDPDSKKQFSSSKEALLKGCIGYMGDEYHKDFPNLYINVIKKTAVANSYTNTSNDHKRRTLSSRGNLQSQYTRRRVSENITPIIMKYAKEYDLNPHIIKAVIEIESSYNPQAYSYAGACGLMQLKPGTASDMGVTDYWNPDQNIKAGAKYLRYMLNKFKDLDIALAAYNQGPGTVQRAGSKIPNATARHYVKKFYEALKRQ